MHWAFEHNRYLFRRRVVSVGTFDVHDEGGQRLLYSKQNPFKFADDFKLYSNDGQEVLIIRTPKTMKEGRTYEVEDMTTGESVGKITTTSLMFKEEWCFFSSKGRRIGKLVEQITPGLLHRILRLVPQRYVVISEDGRTIAEIKQHFKWWVLKYTLTILDPKATVDKRLLVASVILTGTEGKFVVPS